MPRVPRIAMRTGSGPGCLGTSQSRGEVLRCGLANGVKVEPARHILIVHTAALHDFAAFRHDALPVPEKKRKGFERRMLPHETTADDYYIARRDGKEITLVQVPADIFHPQQKTVFHRVHV